MAGATRNESKIYIADAGSGKGYLASRLTLDYGLNVLGIDWNPQLEKNSLSHFDKLQQRWAGMQKRAAEAIENPAMKTGKPRRRSVGVQDRNLFSKDSSNENYQTVSHRIDSDTNVLELLRQEFSTEDAVPVRVILSGLHTCGDLSPTCIRLFTTDEHISDLCNIGCCYHLITEKFDTLTRMKLAGQQPQEKSFTNSESGTFGFPMSKFLKIRKVSLGRNARMVACQSLPRLVEQQEEPHCNLFYRALLEVLVRRKHPNSRDEIEVGRIKSCKTFVEYAEKCGKKNPAADFSDWAIEDIEMISEQYADKEVFLHLYHLMRVALAPVIETIILLDRILYLKELEAEGANINSFIVKFFDDVISPRCYGIIATKN